MSTRLAACITIFVTLAMPAAAHRLDEYLQATILSVEKDHVQAFLRLIPGVTVFSVVLASIDTNGDGILSETEQRSYAERVLHDLSLTIDDKRLRPHLISVNFPRTEEIKEGLGEIQIEFRVDLPGGRSSRKLTFENHHQNRIAAYLVNCLVPRDRNIRIVGQNRNQNQSFYQLNYVQAGGRSDLLRHSWLWGVCGLLGITVALLLAVGMALLWWRQHHSCIPGAEGRLPPA